MTRPETARRLRCLHQATTQALRLVECQGEIDTSALLKAAVAVSDARRLAVRGVMALVYEETAGVVVGDEAGTFSARIYEIPYGVGSHGE